MVGEANCALVIAEDNGGWLGMPEVGEDAAFVEGESCGSAKTRVLRFGDERDDDGDPGGVG